MDVEMLSEFCWWDNRQRVDYLERGFVCLCFQCEGYGRVIGGKLLCTLTFRGQFILKKYSIESSSRTIFYKVYVIRYSNIFFKERRISFPLQTI